MIICGVSVVQDFILVSKEDNNKNNRGHDIAPLALGSIHNLTQCREQIYGKHFGGHFDTNCFTIYSNET